MPMDVTGRDGTAEPNRTRKDLTKSQVFSEGAYVTEEEWVVPHP